MTRAPASLLIVEDEIIIARDLEARLTGLGYVVTGIASSGAEALRRVAEALPDLILMDVVLKGEMDGIETAAQIRHRFGRPVIYLTAYTDPKTLARARVTEPFGYIVKPFTERELHANIEMALYKHRSEMRLRQLERWFADDMDEVAAAVVAADHRDHVMYMNEAAEALTAWPRQQAFGRPLREVVRLERRSTGAPVAAEADDEGPVAYLADDTVLVDRHDRRLSADVTTSRLRDNDDGPSGTVIVMRDVSGERQGAVAMLTADVGMAAAQGVSLEGMLHLCAESMVRHLHAAFARIWVVNAASDMLLLRASAGQAPHSDGPHARVRVGDFEVGRIAEERTPYLSNDIANDPRVSDPAWARREGLVAFAGCPLLLDDRLVGVLAMFARHPLNRHTMSALAAIAPTVAMGIDRKRLEEQLRTSQRLEAVGRLAGGIAHDFNNLLTIISGCSEVLLTSTSLDADARRLVRDVATAGERAAALTRQLLVFSRRQPAETQAVDLAALVAGTKRMLGRLIGEDILLATSTTEPASVMADPGQLEQVVLNLAVNARDAMPDGGRLLIETGAITLDEALATALPEVTPGRYAVLSVSDTGTGMAPEVAARAFEPFFTTKEPGEGTGLGLATVYGIVRQAGGHVTLYSEPGLGTMFRVYLPLITADAGDAEPLPPVRSMPRGTETILLVEDEETVRNLAQLVLERCGYTVLSAANGREALRVAQGHARAIALLVTDVVMPLMAGRALAERMATIRPDMRVLYMSGYTDDAVLRHGVIQEGAAFLQKPFLPSALATRVREVLDAPHTSAAHPH
jgi:two-component system, cell cycle sensor histidine kinase and response regulator CckA